MQTHKLLALIAIGLCAYGFYCVLHMREYVGTPYYFSNPWFYKSSAVMVTVIALRIGMTLRIKK